MNQKRETKYYHEPTLKRFQVTVTTYFEQQRLAFGKTKLVIPILIIPIFFCDRCIVSINKQISAVQAKHVSRVFVLKRNLCKFYLSFFCLRFVLFFMFFLSSCVHLFTVSCHTALHRTCRCTIRTIMCMCIFICSAKKHMHVTRKSSNQVPRSKKSPSHSPCMLCCLSQRLGWATGGEVPAGASKRKMLAGNVNP